MVSLAQCLFFNVLVREIPRKTEIADPKAVLAAGAAGWRKIVPQSDVLGVQSSYMIAVRSVFVLALVAGGLAFLVSLSVSSYVCVEQDEVTNTGGSASEPQHQAAKVFGGGRGEGART